MTGGKCGRNKKSFRVKQERNTGTTLLDQLCFVGNPHEGGDSLVATRAYRAKERFRAHLAGSKNACSTYRGLGRRKHQRRNSIPISSPEWWIDQNMGVRSSAVKENRPPGQLNPRWGGFGGPLKNWKGKRWDHL